MQGAASEIAEIAEISRQEEEEEAVEGMNVKELKAKAAEVCVSVCVCVCLSLCVCMYVTMFVVAGRSAHIFSRKSSWGDPPRRLCGLENFELASSLLLSRHVYAGARVFFAVGVSFLFACRDRQTQRMSLLRREHHFR